MIQPSQPATGFGIVFKFWLEHLVWNGHIDYLCGAVWRWSILAMHPILRKFVYQTDASLSVIGSTPSYGQGRDLRGQIRSANMTRGLPWGAT